MKLRLFPVVGVALLATISAAVLVLAAPAAAQAQPVGAAPDAASASASASACVQVEVQNVRPEQGFLMVAAFADAASFNSRPVASLQLRAGAASTLSFPVCNLSGGSVALMLYQDLNSDGKLGRNVLGIPTEPWGASGKPAAMSAPTWETTHVAIDASPVVVKLSK